MAELLFLKKLCFTEIAFYNDGGEVKWNFWRRRGNVDDPGIDLRRGIQGLWPGPQAKGNTKLTMQCK